MRDLAECSVTNVPAHKTPPGTVEATFRAYGAPLYKFLMYRLRHRENAEDVAQQVYVRLLQYGNIDLGRQPLAYLCRIATHVVDELLLRQYKGPVTFDSQAADYWLEHFQSGDPADLGAPSGSSASQDTLAPTENAQDLECVLSQLPPMYRAVLTLRKCEGLSYAEIAEHTGLSIHTVKKYMRLALAQSRTLWLTMNRTGRTG